MSASVDANGEFVAPQGNNVAEAIDANNPVEEQEQIVENPAVEEG